MRQHRTRIFVQKAIKSTTQKPLRVKCWNVGTVSCVDDYINCSFFSTAFIIPKCLSLVQTEQSFFIAKYEIITSCTGIINPLSRSSAINKPICFQSSLFSGRQSKEFTKSSTAFSSDEFLFLYKVL